MFLGRLGGRALFEKTDVLAAPGAAREKLLHKAVAAVTGVTVLLTGSGWADGFHQPLSADFVADQSAALAKSADNWVRNQIAPGHPRQGQTLDQAAFIQMFALQAMTPTQISAVG